MDKLQQLEEELSTLPKGTIVWKKISKNSNIKKPYLQWRDGSKTKSRYIHADELKEITKAVEKRKIIQPKINSIKSTILPEQMNTPQVLPCELLRLIS